MKKRCIDCVYCINRTEIKGRDLNLYLYCSLQEKVQDCLCRKEVDTFSECNIGEFKSKFVDDSETLKKIRDAIDKDDCE